MTEVNTWTPADQRCRATAPYLVDAARIREFARAVQDFHPAHWSTDAAAELGFTGLVAPATFACAILGDVQSELLDAALADCRPARILHADQVFDAMRPLVAGDRLTGDLTIESFRQFADYDVLTIKSVLTDQHGAPVQTGSTALLAHTGSSGPRLAETVRAIRTRAQSAPRPRRTGHRVPARPRSTPLQLRHNAFHTLTVGTTLPAQTVRLSRDDILDFAAIVGDRAPDTPGTASATDYTLPASTAPSMLKLGLAAAFVGSRLGDPAAITRLRAQFAHYTHYLRIGPAATCEIEFTGRVTAVDARRRRATIAIDARSSGRTVFGYAAAEVALPAQD
ncbi:FAS1-like dehydratase domain-containing protein [Nocardia brasiliensis]|uniref:FAS1-like dehydratase domain-containing protein n=1 Tax=Nocardia brasiliensis TaxID=37326 RepID=UPI002456CC02|nr:MaoC family dehydratase N-terminal domain-containing protein [Nocardia brasiliensis]